MVVNTPTQALPYPEARDSVKVQSRDFRNLALAADAAINATAAAARASHTSTAAALATTRTDLLARMDDMRSGFTDLLKGVQSAYDVYRAQGGTLPVDDWLASLRGPRGPEGPVGGTEVADPQVASWVTDPDSVTGGALTTMFRRSVSVMEHGAVGDGIVDDAPAVQAAMDALAAEGGGTLFFPPGRVFHFSGYVCLASNVHLLGYGATIIKTSTQDTFNTSFYGPCGTGTGYGSGVTDITCEGLTFRGTAATEGGRSNTAMSLHRAARVLIRNCRFIECQASGHTFDLGGCEDITFRDCTFAGYILGDGAYKGDGTEECIQLDQSKRGSVTASPEDELFDGTVTRRVTIDNCRFLPLTVDGVEHPCPNPLGNHSTREGSPYTGVVFTNNVVEHPYANVTDSATLSKYRGAIHLIGTTNVHIAGNRFIAGPDSRARVIALYSLSRGNPASQDPDVNQPVTDIAPTGCTDVSITDNLFEGFECTEASNPVVSTFTVSGSPATTDRLVVRGNVLTGRASDSVVEMRFQNVRGLTVADNRFKAAGPVTHAPVTVHGASDAVVAAGNLADGGYTAAIRDQVSGGMAHSSITGNINY